MPRIVVLDTLSPDGLKLLDEAKAKGVEYEVRTGLKGDALRETLAQFEGAICRSGVKLTAEALAGNHKLKAIVRAGVGTDNIDKEAATRLGIVVMNTPGANAIAVAELTIALMLELMRPIRRLAAAYAEGRFEAARKNPRLIVEDGLPYGTLQIHGVQAGYRQPAQIGNAVVDHAVRNIGPGTQVLDRRKIARVQQQP